MLPAVFCWMENFSVATLPSIHEDAKGAGIHDLGWRIPSPCLDLCRAPPPAPQTSKSHEIPTIRAVLTFTLHSFAMLACEIQST